MSIGVSHFYIISIEPVELEVDGDLTDYAGEYLNVSLSLFFSM